MKISALIAAICSMFVLVACGGGDSTETEATTALSPSTSTPSSSTAADEEPSAKAPKGSDAEEPIAGTLKPPKLAFPSGPPPSRMIVKDLKRGWGPAVKPHMRLVVHFIGIDYKSRKPYEVRWQQKQPFLFEYDHGLPLKGWERGMVGMRVGGIRKMIIPSRLAYGRGAVVYAVELLAAEDRSQYSMGPTLSKVNRGKPPKPPAGIENNRIPPKVSVPPGPPPQELVVKRVADLVGSLPRTGEEIGVQYVGVDYGSGKEFAVHWGPKHLFKYRVGSGEVPDYWETGLKGATVGDRRELRVPASLTKGKGAQVYVIEVIEVENR